MNKRIAVVGCGQLGSRHLQAIARLNGNLDVQVVEPNSDNQEIGKQRLQEVSPETHKISVLWLKDIEELYDCTDLTIVATTSRGRSGILKRLAQKGHKRFLIEKMVCQSQVEYDEILDIFDSMNIKAWVDCTRPYFPFYREVISLMQNEKIVFFDVCGGNHGLGSNAIHLLDIFGRISGSLNDITLNGQYLVPKFLQNRRGEDLIEFAGTILAGTPNGSFASVSFHPNNDAPLVVRITSDNFMIFVDEGKDRARIARKENKWKWNECKFEVLFSSAITTEIARSLFERDTCDLPTIHDSYRLHCEIFRIFNQHIHCIAGTTPSLCPIT